MREFLPGLWAGLALTPAAVWAWIALRRKRRDPTPSHTPSPRGEGRDERQELERLTAQAGMQNFYLYDGSPQRDPREMARDYYERKGK